jgi:uncharacterized damage-inducible protein DinB
MSANPQSQLTIGQSLPWVNMMFDYTEKIAAALPENLRDWRPTDPSGKFFFSLGELVAHMADARLMFARQLTGNTSEDGYISSGPNEEGVWPFGDLGTPQDLVARLKTARAELQPWLDKPAAEQWTATDGTTAVFEKNLAQMKEKGQDTVLMEQRGPANVNRILFAVVAHESGHRGVLQTLLRMNGVELGGEN